jgi:peptidoglycan-associated lipoprotein
MELTNSFKNALVALLLTAVVGCASTGGSDTDSSDVASGENGYGAGDRAALEVDENAASLATQNLLKVTTFYFDLDQATIKPTSRAALQAHAAYLVENGGSAVLEGHADERGTREYNLALGERRAQAIARYLIVLGVPSEQLETVSYGEERAIRRSHDETAWALNRRVQLNYGQ